MTRRHLAASVPLGLMAMPLRTRSMSFGMASRHACIHVCKLKHQNLLEDKPAQWV